MPFCNECGKEYPEGSKFCQECGSKTIHEERALEEDPEHGEIHEEPSIKQKSNLDLETVGKGMQGCGCILTLLITIPVIIFFLFFL